MTGRRFTLLALAALFGGFAAYGSFVPLRWNAVPLDEALARFASTPFLPVGSWSGSDFLTNVLLFVPIGFFLLGVAANRSRGAALILLVPVVGLCLAWSVAIEFGQIFVSGRTPSWNDVFAETLGGALGCGAWVVLGSAVVDWLAQVAHSDSPTDRLFRLLAAYAAVWLVLGLLPFDYTIRPAELTGKFRSGRILLVPFNGRDTLADTVGTFLLAVPIGIFGVLAGAHWKAARPAAMGLAVAVGATLLVEFAQLLALSRTADVTDVILNGAGSLLGVYLGARTLARSSRVAHDGSIRLWPLAALGAWCVVLVLRHWTPFNFVVDGEFVRGRLPMMFRVPFHSYYWGMPIFAFAEAMSKILLGLPIGALLQWTWTPARRTHRSLQMFGIVFVAAGVLGVVELGQLLLPTRFPDQTDVYLGMLGAVAGVLGVRLVVSAPYNTRGAPQARPPEEPR